MLHLTVFFVASYFAAFILLVIANSIIERFDCQCGLRATEYLTGLLIVSFIPLYALSVLCLFFKGML